LLFAEADKKTGLKLATADRELIDILAEEKCLSEEVMMQILRHSIDSKKQKDQQKISQLWTS
jgi:hypothetical protein